MKQTTNHARGFTLIELLVVIGIIATLGAVSYPVYMGMQKKMDKQKLLMVFNSLGIAMENFETEYNYLPYSADDYPAADVYYNTTAAFSALLQELTGQSSNSNFKEIAFLDGPEAKGKGGTYYSGLSADGDALYSPWGTQFFRMKIDYNLDGILSIPRAVPVDQEIGSWVIYDWSCGDGALEPVDDNFIAYRDNIVYPGWLVD